MREFSKRIKKAFKRLCDPFKRTLNGYKRIFPLNAKALVSVFAFQVNSPVGLIVVKRCLSNAGLNSFHCCLSVNKIGFRA